MKFLFILLSAFSFNACTQPGKLRSFSGEALGTSYQVQFYGSERFPVQEKFDSVVAAINQSMSTYIPNSDISRINRGDTTVVVDAMFREVLSLSRKIYEASGGYYDPTVGILVNAYGFGPDKPVKVLGAAQLDSLKHYVGLDKITLSPKGNIKTTGTGVYLDFNSIAKGYCIDRIGIMLEANGVQDYLIEMGGELRARGKNLDREGPWTVGIENPDAPVEDRTYTRTVSLVDMGMAGSGNYRKFRTDSITGKKYVHTINPLTGLAEQSDVLSSTVIAKTCAEADGYATAFMALGLERSKEVLKKINGVDAYLLHHLGDSIEVFMSKNFTNYLNPGN